MNKKHGKIYIALSIITAIIVIIGLGCNGNNAGVKNAKTVKTDSSSVMAVYVTAGADDIGQGNVVRHIRTLLIPDTNDYSKNIITYDSMYAVPTVVFVEDSITKKLVVDSTGIPVRTIRYWWVPRNTVWDSGVKIDTSKTKELIKFIRHPAGKPDTLKISQKEYTTQ